MKKTPKKVFEKMVMACGKTLGLSGVETSIDGTGFSNTNPSHYYIKRIAEQGNKVSVKNFTKTLFLIDNETKIILNVKTFSRNVSESIHFKQMVSEIKNSLKSVLADKGYDSMNNREYCWNKGIEVHILLRKYKSQQIRMGEQNYTAKRRRALQKFDEVKYRGRSLIESVNSAIKRTLGNYTNNKKPSTQQKQITIKALTYNIERINKTTNTIKLTINLTIQQDFYRALWVHILI